MPSPHLQLGVREENDGVVLVLSDRTKRRALAAELGHRGIPAVSADYWCEIEPAVASETVGVVVLEIPRGKTSRGVEWIRSVRARVPKAELLVLCETTDAGLTRTAFLLGARDCCEMPAGVAWIVDTVEAALACRRRGRKERTADFAQPAGRPESPVSNESTEAVGRWARSVENLLRTTFVQSTWALVEAVEAKDPSTRAHSIRVSVLAEVIGRRMAVASPAIRELRAAALLHDVGKIGVPDAILNKAGPLTRPEYEVIKTHPGVGVQILGGVGPFSEMKPVILHHHEWFDGHGYPGGLQREEIPIGARILTVADAMETMLASRTYKPAFPVDRVRSELVAGAGRQFDPAVVAAAVQWLDEPGMPELATTESDRVADPAARVAGDMIAERSDDGHVAARTSRKGLLIIETSTHSDSACH